MPAININDLNNAQLDVTHIAAIATSTALTATDRLGNIKKTVAGLSAQLLNAGIYATTAAGLAATANGQYFTAIAGESNTYLVLYLNNSGAAVEQKRYPATAYITDATQLHASEAVGRALVSDGAIFQVIGSGDIAAFQYRRTNATTSILVATYPAQSAVAALKALADGLGFDLSYTGSGYALAWLDSLSSFALGIRNDGVVIFGRGGDVAQRLDLLELQNATAPTFSDLTYNRSGYAQAVLDSQGNLAGGFDASGDFINKGLNLRSATASFLSGVGVVNKFITPSGFFTSGDSLTAGAGGTPYPTQLATLLGKPVTNFGIGGQTAQNISGRFGGSVPFVTITGNTIPSSGAVTVTAQTFQIHNNQGPGTVAGTLAGVPGSLNATAFDAGGTPTAVNFTRTTAGTALVIDSSTAFIVDTSDNRQFGTVIFWYGRNNVGSPTLNTDVKQALADAIGQLKTVDRRFVVMSVLNTSSEVAGSGTYLTITQLNNDLRALYPRNFIDIRALLVRSGTGTGADATDLANDCTPTSLRSDSIHLNTSGYGVVANAVFNFLNTKGWLA